MGRLAVLRSANVVPSKQREFTIQVCPLKQEGGVPLYVYHKYPAVRGFSMNSFTAHHVSIKKT
jgi:hypothetical protein